MYNKNVIKKTNGYGVQGDVPIIKRDQLPDGCKPRSGNVLREGESTGHHHVILAEPWTYQLYDAPDGMLWMELFAEVEIAHPEHGVLIYPPGIYIVPEQVEYDGFEDRLVLD
jgi:hypothetical protein